MPTLSVLGSQFSHDRVTLATMTMRPVTASTADRSAPTDRCVTADRDRPAMVTLTKPASAVTGHSHGHPPTVTALTAVTPDRRDRCCVMVTGHVVVPTFPVTTGHQEATA